MLLFSGRNFGVSCFNVLCGFRRCCINVDGLSVNLGDRGLVNSFNRRRFLGGVLRQFSRGFACGFRHNLFHVLLCCFFCSHMALSQRRQATNAGIAGAGQGLVRIYLGLAGCDGFDRRRRFDMLDVCHKLWSGTFGIDTFERSVFNHGDRLSGSSILHWLLVGACRETYRLDTAILGNRFAGQDDWGVVLRQGNALMFARFARLIFAVAATATIPVTVTTASAATTITVSAVTVPATAVTAIRIFAGTALGGRSRRRSLAIGAIVFRNGLAGQQHGRKGRCNRCCGLRFRNRSGRFDFGFRLGLRHDLFGFVHRASQAVNHQATGLKAAQFALSWLTRSTLTWSSGLWRGFILWLFGALLLGGLDFGIRRTGLCVGRLIADYAVPSTTTPTAAAAATPARRASIFAVCRGSFAFGNRLIFNLFGVFFFDRQRLGNDQAVGVGQSRSCNFDIPEFVVIVFVLEFQKIRNIQERIALKTDIDKGRLHAREDAGNAALVYGARQRVFVLALELHLSKLIVFHQRHLGFVRRG